MSGFWLAVVAGMLAGALGAAATLLAWDRLRSGQAAPVEPPAPPPREPGAVDAATGRPEPGRVDGWLRDLHRCEQAVSRARCAVESVSSARARESLLMVVRRMDAELPTVQALVEVGRTAGPAGDERVLRRVRAQVAEAAQRFTAVTEEVLDVVVELVALPDLHRVHRDVAVLRDRFPLLRPLSALLERDPDPVLEPA
ncbi:hypothetical protein ACL03H_19425 [Saccharopolyspora sp. MS10]|uniref:hypothetical protein n=1 Tax=Saccharopolyspora sp. MS10 TaxID=3385973 RepID=UPI00399FA16B